MAATRNVTPIIAKIRDFFSQRAVKNHLRFETTISPRSQPAPSLPGGPSHRLAANHYYTRDGRRECFPPELAYEKVPKAIASGEQGGDVPALSKPPKPGFHYDWSTGQFS